MDLDCYGGEKLMNELCLDYQDQEAVYLLDNHTYVIVRAVPALAHTMPLIHASPVIVIRW